MTEMDALTPRILKNPKNVSLLILILNAQFGSRLTIQKYCQDT